ncbi:MAG: AAA family ATPase [Phycisphaerales bacterium]|nr:AAA family ATPase [Phycisphaerales bacterium]
MYCNHFKIKRLPFNNTPDPAFYYSTPDHEEALATLQFAAQHRKGFVLVTGEVGAGKTLIGRMFLRQIDTGAATAVINHTHLNGQQLLFAICRELNLPMEAGSGNVELTQLLQDYLLEQYARGRSVVVLLDEAQNLPDASFEELRMLGNLEADDAKLLQVCILGQPELRDHFRRSSLKQFEQRLFRRFHLPALNLEQTLGYINHRLVVAGAADPNLFTPEAIRRIFTVSQGIPRVINHLCDNALLTAYGQQSNVVDEAIIDQVTEQDTPTATPKEIIKGDSDARLTAEARVENESRSRRVERRIEQIYGSAPTLTETMLAEPLIDAEESSRLSTLVEEEISNLQERILALHDNPHVSQVDLETICSKQDELQKIVGGASTRWLVAKERIEAYRNELHTAIDSLVDRCDNTQNRLESLTRQLPSNHELEDLRHKRAQEIDRLMQEVKGQRKEFRRLLQQTQEQCSGMHQRVDRLSEEIEQHKVDPATIYRNEQDTRQSREQIEILANRLHEHAAQINSLEQQAAERFAVTQQAIANLENRTPQTGEWQRLRAEHLEALSNVFARFQEENERVQQFQETISTQTQGIAEEHKGLIDQLAERINVHISHMDEVRERLFKQLTDLQNQMRILDQRFASREEVQAIENQTRRARQVARIASHVAKAAKQEGEAIKEQAKAASQEATIALETATAAQQESKATREQAKVASQESAVALEMATAAQQEAQTTRAQAAEAQKSAEVVRHDVIHVQQELQAVRENTETALQTQQADAEEIRRQILDHRQAVHALIDHLATDCRSAQEKIEILAGTKIDQDQLAELNARHESDVRSLLDQLNAHRHEMDDRYEAVFTRWNQTREQIEEWKTTLASVDEMEDIRASQAKDTADIMEALHRQRLDIEAVVANVSQRCADTLEQVRQLPDQVASAEELEAIRTEHNRRIQELCGNLATDKADIEQAIRQVEDRCTITHNALRELADSAASNADVEQLRDEQSKQLHHVLERIEQESNEHQSHVDNLNRRWENLRDSVLNRLDQDNHAHRHQVDELTKRWANLTRNVRKLASITTPASTFHTAQRTLSESLQELGEQVVAVSNKQEQDLHILIDKLQQTAARLDAIESNGVQSAVQIQMSPQVGIELGELIQSAEHLREQLGTSLAQAGSVSEQLQHVSGQVQGALAQWNEQAQSIHEQTDQLRSSARVAANVLKAMQECSRVVDAKIKSQRWQTELQRGETLVGRLEQATAQGQTVCQQLQAALADFEACERQADDWNHNRQQAQQLGRQLASLLSQAQSSSSRMEKSLSNRQQLLQAIAHNTASLADVIRTARDETEPPKSRFSQPEVLISCE